MSVSQNGYHFRFEMPASERKPACMNHAALKMHKVFVFCTAWNSYLWHTSLRYWNPKMDESFAYGMIYYLHELIKLKMD